MVNTHCCVCEKPLTKNLQANRRRCQSCNTKIRRYRNKLALVKMLGGLCTRCGWTGNIAGFHFHHKDSNKEFELSQYANKAFSVLKAEALKCELVCACCHCIEHSSNQNPKFLAEVALYQGSLLE